MFADLPLDDQQPFVEPDYSSWDVAQHGPDAAEDGALVLELSEQVLARVQEKVYDSLVNREGAL